MSDRTKPRRPTTRPLSPAQSLTFSSKMARKSLLKPTLFASSIFLLLLALYTLIVPFNPSKLDSNFPFDTSSSKSSSYLFSSNLQLNSTQPPPPPPQKVKIYLYDLPREYTYGVIQHYAMARGSTAKFDDDSALTYPGHQHSAEWHLFTDLRDNNNNNNNMYTRVLDPEEADLFYVPFFSSLSLVVNLVRRVGDEAAGYNDEEMQEGLVEWLERQVYWRRNNGRDHVFICQDPNALYKVIDRVKNGVLLVSDFGRLRSDQASLVKDVILPYSHRIKTFHGEIGVEKRNSLLFFMGNRYRKEGGKVRDLLFQILENEKDVVIKHGAQSRESRRAATQGMHSSKFCLHPAGDTPSACRLFDAIVSLCVPVIVSDHIELPFEDVIDYKKIAIFVDSTSAVKPRFLVKVLRKMSTEKIVEYQRELNLVRRYFEYEDPNGTVNEIWRQVSLKLPLIKLMINRNRRLVKRDLTEPDCSCICSNKTGTITTL